MQNTSARDTMASRSFVEPVRGRPVGRMKVALIEPEVDLNLSCSGLLLSELIFRMTMKLQKSSIFRLFGSKGE